MSFKLSQLELRYVFAWFELNFESNMEWIWVWQSYEHPIKKWNNLWKVNFFVLKNDVLVRKFLNQERGRNYIQTNYISTIIAVGHFSYIVAWQLPLNCQVHAEYNFIPQDKYCFEYETRTVSSQTNVVFHISPCIENRPSRFMK